MKRTAVSDNGPLYYYFSSFKYFFASFIKLITINTSTAAIGNAATILTDWRLFMELSANTKAIGNKINKIHHIN